MRRAEETSICRHGGPHVEGALPQHPIVNRPESMSGQSKQILNDAVNVQEMLSLIRRLEASHLSLALSLWLV